MEVPVQKEVSVSESCKMVECSRIPGSHGTVAWKRVKIRTRCKRCISFNTCIRSTAVILGGYTFEACISKRVEFDEGSSGTRAVVEVVVLATVVEVVVHVL